jgi:hypothetical protein
MTYVQISFGNGQYKRNVLSEIAAFYGQDNPSFKE